MDVTVPFHVCWNVWGSVHSSNIVLEHSINLHAAINLDLPEWSATAYKTWEFNLSLLVKALTILSKVPNILLLWNAESGLNNVHCSCKLPTMGKPFLRGALRNLLFKPCLQAPPLIPHKACPLRLLPFV
jgi:hypothetical protein